MKQNHAVTKKEQKQYKYLLMCFGYGNSVILLVFRWLISHCKRNGSPRDFNMILKLNMAQVFPFCEKMRKKKKEKYAVILVLND